jgi:hypothetical protein
MKEADEVGGLRERQGRTFYVLVMDGGDILKNVLFDVQGRGTRRGSPHLPRRRRPSFQAEDSSFENFDDAHLSRQYH